MNICEKIFVKIGVMYLLHIFKEKGKLWKISKIEEIMEEIKKTNKHYFPWIITGQERITIRVGVLHSI